jgi:cardiolipin synthase
MTKSSSSIPPVSGSYPQRAGNAVRPLIDSGPAFRRICEAVEAAQRSIWLTITFMAPDFAMPDDRGTILDVLDGAVARGLDVRVLFWRPNPESSGYGQAFAGSSADRQVLAARQSRFRARWDRIDGTSCQHQKSWLIDAGHPSETSFVGGINPTFGSFAPGHEGEGHRHDVYVELSGPSATDVHHNFVQRWNEASERLVEDGAWGHTGADDLGFPARVSSPRGESVVQVQRTIPAGRYLDIAGGERSIFEQYLAAIDAARRSIYIENQAFPVPEVATRLAAALRRGVEVVLLVPAACEEFVRQADPSLAAHPTFMLAGIAGRSQTGARAPVYVHDKLMLVDDEWATIGSCNLHAYSLFRNSEMNVSIWDAKLARALRIALFSEHLAEDTGQLDDRAALQRYRLVAESNRRKRDATSSDWQGLAFAMTLPARR